MALDVGGHLYSDAGAVVQVFEHMVALCVPRGPPYPFSQGGPPCHAFTQGEATGTRVKRVQRGALNAVWENTHTHFNVLCHPLFSINIHKI